MQRERVHKLQVKEDALRRRRVVGDPPRGQMDGKRKGEAQQGSAQQQRAQQQQAQQQQAQQGSAAGAEALRRSSYAAAAGGGAGEPPRYSTHTCIGQKWDDEWNR